jgi:asparagine synthase (glutamine-hydrolysing)
MSVQYGTWRLDGGPPDRGSREMVNSLIAPFGPDNCKVMSKEGVDVIYRAFHTTKESRCEEQPYVSTRGLVITWDGRLDNRSDLIRELKTGLTASAADVVIVSLAYEIYGTECFSKLIGDWALSIWHPSSRSLILARDPIGLRRLYYSMSQREIKWSTILRPLVLLHDGTPSICEEYIAGWLARQHPAPHLTPYVGIHSVPPSCYVSLMPNTRTISKYWDFDPTRKIRYRTDGEYEEHFRAVFAKAVERRLRCDRPVLAHLSGGMDSSSIVCMADMIGAQCNGTLPRLDTISWYDETNPALDELPYFTKVEEKRGVKGVHIDLSTLVTISENGDPDNVKSQFSSKNSRLDVTPYSANANPEFSQRYAQCLASQGYRVVLSGVAGDETTGSGVPSPVPELQNLLARLRLVQCLRQMNAWASKMGTSRPRLFWEVASGFLVGSSLPPQVSRKSQRVFWLRPEFLKRNRAALSGYSSRVKLFGPLPSFQRNIETLNRLRRIVSSFADEINIVCETRYPYLDRCFLEFMYAIPREQIVRVGQRRSLMKRALAGIVPHEILTRRQQPLAELDPGYPDPAAVAGDAISSSIGIVDSDKFREALEKAWRKQEIPVRSLRRTLQLEDWLRHLEIQGILKPSGSKIATGAPS